MKNSTNSARLAKPLEKGTLRRGIPNPNGKNGKPIILPPTTFEEAVKKMLNTPAPPKEEKPKKKTSEKR